MNNGNNYLDRTRRDANKFAIFNLVAGILLVVIGSILILFYKRDIEMAPLAAILFINAAGFFSIRNLINRYLGRKK